MSDILFPKVGQGPAKLATDEEIQRDAVGFTHPNLHRRIDPQILTESNEYHPREYQLAINSLNSYRTTTIHSHDEDTELDEIP